MTVPIMICLLLLASMPAEAKPKPKKSGFNKFVQSLFAPRHPVKVRMAQKKARPKLTKKQAHRIITVDKAWMDQYWALEKRWDYYIPEDDSIKVKADKYHVPIVVYRHYEDMADAAE